MSWTLRVHYDDHSLEQMSELLDELRHALPDLRFAFIVEPVPKPARLFEHEYDHMIVVCDGSSGDAMFAGKLADRIVEFVLPTPEAEVVVRQSLELVVERLRGTSATLMLVAAPARVVRDRRAHSRWVKPREHLHPVEAFVDWIDPLVKGAIVHSKACLIPSLTVAIGDLRGAVHLDRPNLVASEPRPGHRHVGPPDPRGIARTRSGEATRSAA